ncbi:MAG: hypothetical protein ACK4KW_13420 [Gemmobacter sp.]
MLRPAAALAVLLALAACAPEVPDSARGVGFESYADYMARRQAELSGVPPSRQPPISGERIASAPAPAPQPLPSGERPRADTFAGIAPQSGELRHAAPGSPRISDEQDFDAVAARESIESDAERLRRQREQYVVVQPTALPTRTGPAGPNIVEFALSTRHSPGTQMYRRGGIRFTSYESACGRFVSADLAQEEFLRRGGPERDPMGVDPDGDGFACGWDPRPFRAALQ